MKTKSNINKPKRQRQRRGTSSSATGTTKTLNRMLTTSRKIEKLQTEYNNLKGHL